MKAAPLALFGALLGATAIVPASAQAQSAPGQSEASPSPATNAPMPRRGRDGAEAQAQPGPREDREEGRTRWSRHDDMDDMDEVNDVRMGNRMGDRMDQRGMGQNKRMGQGMPIDPAMMRMHMQMMQAHHEGGARFQLKRGDQSMDIRCPAGEKIGDCVEAVGKLMDRLQAMPQNR